VPTWFVLIIMSHVLVAIALVLLGLRRRAAVLLAAAPLAAMLSWSVVALLSPSPLDGRALVGDLEWIPSLGVSLALRIDALSLIFLLLIAGVGLAIVAFSGSYMRKLESPGGFLALLVLFAAAMNGLVAVDNVFGLFVFWELTTVTSYLLIGFEDRKGSARAAAFQAMLTTGLGGLALLAGLVLLSQEAGTTSLAEIIAVPPSGAMASVALGLVLLGVFTKSAQAPFHFWLPGAMAAPTPVSAYLHSATMVKAGIFLLIRLAPGFAGDPLWAPAVVTVGLATMAIGAWRALRQTDLKLLLAHGTVSQLGLMTALAGIGAPPVLHAAVSIVVAHALFKSALFLTLGTVDSAAGTRDLRLLSGLGRRLPVVAMAGGLAAASMAGVAPLLGFVAKEAAFAALIDDGQWIAMSVIAVASIATVGYSLRFWWGAFGTKPGSEPGSVGDSLNRPAAGLVMPPVVLAAIGLLFGVVPGGPDQVVSAAAPGGKLILWPGWNLALAVSGGVLAAGLGVHLRRDPVRRLQRKLAQWANARLGTPSAERSYELSVSGLNRLADRVTGIVQNGSLPVYLAIILSVTVAVPAVAWVVSGGRWHDSPWAFTASEAILVVFAAAAALAVTRVRSRLAAVLLLGAVGYAVAGLFVVYGAPDLALTLLLVETITVAIFAFVLMRLPRRFEVRKWRIRGWIRGTVAAGIGVFVAAGTLVAAAQRSALPVSEQYAELAPGAGGTNVVNVILTDFRALDTLGEITVVGIAALGVAALVAGLRSPSGGEA
jgi:multicomponent Na+:H+ antiporter subunit A